MNTLTTQIYIDSEQTLINDLRDTFSCKTSNESTNILKINTSTYSATRTAGHIMQRLEDASKRLKSIERSGCTRKIGNNNCSGNGNGWKRETGVTEEYQYRRNSTDVFVDAEQDMLDMIAKLTNQLQQAQDKIQTLDNAILTKQNELLQNQQKYLRRQKQLILEINRLQALLDQKTGNEDRHFNEKIEMERIIDENKVKVWELELQLKELLDRYTKWSEKEVMIARTINRYYGKLEREEVSLKGLTKSGKKDKEVLNILRMIVAPCSSLSQTNQNSNRNELISLDYQNQHNKQNNSQLSNRQANPTPTPIPNKSLTQNNKNRVQLQQRQKQNYQIGNFTYRSHTAYKNRRGKERRESEFYRTYEKEYYHEEEEEEEEDEMEMGVGVDQASNDLYQCLMLQAMTIEKLSF